MYQKGDAPARPTPKKKAKPRPRPSSGGDAASGGPRQIERANEYKKRPEYKRAVTKTRQERQRRETRALAKQYEDTEPERKAQVKKAKRAQAIRKLKQDSEKRRHETTLGNLKKELEGKGKLAAALDYAAKHTSIASTGAGPVAPGSPLAKQKKKGKLPGATITPIDKRTAAGRLVTDFITFPAQAIPSVYQPVAGVVEAAQGNPKRLKEVGKSISENDPVYNTVAAGVEAVKGNSKAAKEHLKKAEKAASEHPGLTAIEVAGVKGAVGRGVGSAMRSGALGKGAKAAASTKRASRVVPGTRIEEHRQYLRDVTKKAVQVAHEKSRRRKRDKLTKQAEAEVRAGNLDKARDLKQQAARIDPDRLTEREIKRQVDERVAVNEDIRRVNRGRVVKEAKKVLGVAKRENQAVSVVTQRIASATREDLQKFVNELEQEFPRLSNHRKRENKDLRRKIQAVIDDPKADMGRLEEVASHYENLTKPLQDKLVRYGLLNKDQAERARLIPYAIRHMNAEHVQRKIVDAEGEVTSVSKIMARTEKYPALKTATDDLAAARREYKAAKEADTGVEVAGEALELAKKRLETAREEAHRDLTNEEIRAHMEGKGVKNPAFVSQASNINTARSFNVRSERAVKASQGKRTGESTKAGTFDGSSDALVANAANAQGLVDAARGFRAIIKDTGYREKGALRVFQSFGKAQEAAKNYLHDETGEPIPGRHELVPIRLNALGAPKEQLEALLEDVNMEHSIKSQLLAEVEAAKTGKPTSGTGGWALVPRAALERLSEHLNRQGGSAGAKTAQLVNQAFRRTVLSTSTAWFAGNVIEGVGRAALARAGVGSYIFAHRTLKRLEQINPNAYEEAVHRIIGGGHYSVATRGHIRRGAESFEGEGRLYAGVATALGKFWRTPGPKQAAELWGAWTDLAFHTVNGRIESTIQTAMLGRALKNANIMDAKLARTGKKAVHEAALGLTGTPDQIMFGRMVDQMYGRYSKFSPSMRHYLSLYTPFAAWAMNAAAFVYRTLPRDHPVASAVTASSEMATQEWREKMGLDQFMGEGALPPFLQGQIPMKGGAHFRLTRYTPFGAFSNFPESYASQVLPVASGVIAALKGEDWKGKKLTVKGEDGKTRDANPIERLVFGALAFGQATIPIEYQAERLIQGGPGVLNPLRPMAPAKPKERKRAYVPHSYNNTSSRRNSSISGPSGGHGSGSRVSSGIAGPSGGHGSGNGGLGNIAGP